MVYTEDNLEINLNAPYNLSFINSLKCLGRFLVKYNPGNVVKLYAYDSPRIGGLRIQEISFIKGKAGGSYQRLYEHLAVILAAEMVCETYGIEPYRPGGWTSVLNEHGEAKVNLLNAMGMKDAAEKEYQEQLEDEKKI